MGRTKNTGKPKSLGALTVPLRAAPPVRIKVTQAVADALSRCHDEGLRVDQTQARVEAETGVRLARGPIVEYLQQIAAARIDALRTTLPQFKDNVDRCEYHIGEVAAIASTLKGHDLDNYIRVSELLIKWVTLQERIATQQLQQTNQNLTINVTDADAKDRLVSKLAGLIERSGTGTSPGKSDPAGSGGTGTDVGVLGTPKPAST